MKECDKRKSHISTKIIWSTSIYLLLMLDTLLLRASLHLTQLHFTPLHYTCRHFTSSHLNLTQLHCTTISLDLTPFKSPTPPFTITVRKILPSTSMHFVNRVWISRVVRLSWFSRFLIRTPASKIRVSNSSGVSNSLL